MKVNRNYYKIDVDALYKEFICTKIKKTDPILFLKFKIESLYNRIVYNNDLELIQEKIDGSEFQDIIKKVY